MLFRQEHLHSWTEVKEELKVHPIDLAYVLGSDWHDEHVAFMSFNG